MDNQKLGAKIKEIRVNKGLTMEEFGKLFDTSKSTVNNWEKGRNSPNKFNLKAIADFANTTVDELLSSEEKSNTNLPLYNRELLEAFLNEAWTVIKALFINLFVASDSASNKAHKTLETIEDEETKEAVEKMFYLWGDNTEQKINESLLYIEKLQNAVTSSEQTDPPFFIYNGIVFFNFDNINDLSEDDITDELNDYDIIMVRDNKNNIIYEKQNFTKSDFVEIVKKYFDHGIKIELYSSVARIRWVDSL